jgi:competence protein ComEA
MFSFLKTYFNLSNREQYGVTALTIIILFAFAFPSLYGIFKKPAVSDNTEFEKWTAAFKSMSATEETGDFESAELEPAHTAKAFRNFPFNPNTASAAQFTELGISAKTAENIIKYREKGGKFYKKEDLKKIYGFKEEDYLRLEPYILLDTDKKEPKTTASSPAYTAATPAVIDINTADSAAWVSLRGIGPVYASRIIKYRNLLGGFVSSGQLMEVYGMNDSLYMALLPYLKLENEHIEKLNINTLDAESLKKHPYINYTTANAIVKYRNQNGSFSTLDELNKLYSLDESIIEKIKPYLKISE